MKQRLLLFVAAFLFITSNIFAAPQKNAVPTFGHGGTIDVSSWEGAFTEFIISLLL